MRMQMIYRVKDTENNLSGALDTQPNAIVILVEIHKAQLSDHVDVVRCMNYLPQINYIWMLVCF